MEVHKVVAPPHRSTAAKLKTRLKETFFPDDPLRQFKGQPNRTKLIRAAQYIFPILQWCPEYSFRLLKSDVVSGLTIASLAIPQVHSTFSSERILQNPTMTHFIFWLTTSNTSIKILDIFSKTEVSFFLFGIFKKQGISYAKLANLPPIVGLCKNLKWNCIELFFVSS